MDELVRVVPCAKVNRLIACIMMYADVQLRRTEAVAHTNYWARHQVSEMIHHAEQFPGVVEVIG